MPDIYFKKNPGTNRLKVSIKTERLMMESTSSNHLCNYKKLFMDSENMLKVMDGNPWSEDKIGEKPKWGQLRHFFFLNTIDLKEKPTEFLNDSLSLEIRPL